MKTHLELIRPTCFLFECQLDSDDYQALQTEAFTRYPDWANSRDAEQDERLKHYVMERCLQRFLVQEPRDLRQAPRYKLLDARPSAFCFAAELDVYPEVILPEAGSLCIEDVASPDTSPAEIQTALDALQMTLAHFERVDRPAQWGDQLVLQVYATYQGLIIPQSIQNERVVLLRQNEEASLSEAEWLSALIGMHAGQSKNIAYDLPANHPNPSWRGQRALSHVKVLAVASGHLATPDDGFAQALGFDTLDALQENLGNQLRLRKEAQSRQRLKERVLAALIENSHLEIPHDWIQQELARDFRVNDEPRLRRLGITSADIDSLIQSWLHLPYLQAEKQAQIKSQLVLRAAIRDFDVMVSDAELESALTEWGHSLGKSAEDMRYQLIQENKLRGLSERLLIDKLLEHLLAAATLSAHGQ